MEKKQSPLIHRLSNRLSAQLYSIYLYALAQKNSDPAQALALKRAELTFIKHAQLILPIVYRTRVKPVLGRNAKQLSPFQIKRILTLPKFLNYFKIILKDSSRLDLEFVIFHADTLIETTEEYWKSAAGLKRRIDMLGGHFHYNLINNALQAYGGDPQIAGWLGIPGPVEHCEYCLAHIIGHYFRKGQFLPRLPAHQFCQCSWRLIRRKE